MKATEYRDTHYFFTGRVSDITRNLAFMGFGVIWILIGGLESFKRGNIETPFILIMGLLTISLILDLLQYVYQAILTYVFFKKYEKKDKARGYISDDYEYHNKYNYFSYFLNIIKVLSMIAAYILLIVQLYKMLF